jgi:hypothetical protein
MKAITESQLVINAVAVSGVGSVTSVAQNVKYKDSVAYQFNWTGNPTGAILIQGSLDYNPGAPQSDGTANAGNWNTLPTILSPQVTVGSQTALGTVQQCPTPWVRVLYTNSSGSGVMSVYHSAKSLG